MQVSTGRLTNPILNIILEYMELSFQIYFGIFTSSVHFLLQHKNVHIAPHEAFLHSNLLCTISAWTYYYYRCSPDTFNNLDKFIHCMYIGRIIYWAILTNDHDLLITGEVGRRVFGNIRNHTNEFVSKLFKVSDDLIWK